MNTESNKVCGGCNFWRGYCTIEHEKDELENMSECDARSEKLNKKNTYSTK